MTFWFYLEKKYFEDQQAVYQGRLHLPVYKHMRMCLERELIFISSSEDKKKSYHLKRNEESYWPLLISQ